MISGQSRGKLDNVPASKVKSLMINYLTSKFNEKVNKCFDVRLTLIKKNDNEQWYNDLLRVDTEFNPQDSSLTLKYKDKYIHKSGELILQSPIIFKSAYSENMKNMISFFEKGKTIEGQQYPYNLITNIEDFNSIEINSIKMGFENIDKTIDFVSKLTMESPFTTIKSDSINACDFIMYEGDIKVVKTYNVPDINIIAQDIGPMPNSVFPSDHISLIADFIIE